MTNLKVNNTVKNFETKQIIEALESQGWKYTSVHQNYVEARMPEGSTCIDIKVGLEVKITGLFFSVNEIPSVEETRVWLSQYYV